MVNATSAGSDTAPTIESEQAIDERRWNPIRVFLL